MSPYFYSLLGLFMLMTIGSEPLGYMKNSTCMPYIGCNAGAFGYDVVTHFIFGVVVAVGLVWLSERHPRMRLFGRGAVRNMLVIISIAAFIGLAWELLEFSFDAFRTYALHMDLYHPNQAAQPSVADTIGDLAFGLLGAFFGSMSLSNHIQKHGKS